MFSLLQRSSRLWVPGQTVPLGWGTWSSLCPQEHPGPGSKLKKSELVTLFFKIKKRQGKARH